MWVNIKHLVVKINFFHHGYKVFNMWIMTKVFLVPEAKPRDTKHTAVIIHIIYFMTNLLLMARSEAEGI